VFASAADAHDGCGSSGGVRGGGDRVGVLGFLGRRPEVNRVLSTHANVAGDGGSAGPGDDGAASLGRSLATGKHGLHFFFALLVGGSVASAMSMSSAI
jgi:hypothetical protein